MFDCVKYPTVYMHLSPPGLFYRLNQTDTARGWGPGRGGGGFKTTPSYIHSPRVETETKKSEYKYESTFSIENANLYNFNGNL